MIFFLHLQLTKQIINHPCASCVEKMVLVYAHASKHDLGSTGAGIINRSLLKPCPDPLRHFPVHL
jgi:hypothetical protein